MQINAHQGNLGRSPDMNKLAPSAIKLVPFINTPTAGGEKQLVVRTPIKPRRSDISLSREVAK